eukprot:1151867-Pleurochrysis_carterae.AAC.3
MPFERRCGVAQQHAERVAGDGDEIGRAVGGHLRRVTVCAHHGPVFETSSSPWLRQTERCEAQALVPPNETEVCRRVVFECAFSFAEGCAAATVRFGAASTAAALRGPRRDVRRAWRFALWLGA